MVANDRIVPMIADDRIRVAWGGSGWRTGIARRRETGLHAANGPERSKGHDENFAHFNFSE
jgi:hypothetical protein